MQYHERLTSSFVRAAIFSMIFALTILAMFSLSGTSAIAQTETVLHSFGSTTTDGLEPFASLVMDGRGNLYGTTVYGGTAGLSTLFEMSPTAGGGWKERILFNFHRIRPGVRLQTASYFCVNP